MPTMLKPESAIKEKKTNMSKTFPIYVDGKLLTTKETQNVINPADESIAGIVCSADEKIADQAIDAAARAFKTYSKMSITDREKLILKLRDELLKEKEPMIALLISETGKTRDVAEYDFNMLVDCLGFFIEEVKRKYSVTIPDYGNAYFNYLKYTPVGVVIGLLAWNFPLLNIGYKLGPILATGNTCILRPSSSTPLTGAFLGEILHRIGFPAGVVNILPGGRHEVINHMIANRKPALITMIGSTNSGLQAIKNSATSIKRYSMELGGNAPVIVFDDANVSETATSVVDLKFTNAGQVCVSPNRVFVHEKVYDAFLKKCVQLISEYRLGAGKDPGKILSPVINLRALERMVSWIEEAQKKGARLLTGGKRADRKGFFLEPTLLADVRQDMKVACDEVFGPVMSVIKFNDKDDIFEMANNTDMGLSAYVYTNSLQKTLKAEEELESGNIIINGVHYSIQLPHGGVKQSGIGKDIGHVCLDEYYHIKRISIKR
jgi:succinate-semialdehyde dehydrogenase/glutarate-semialdehyde dehydrogenase